MDKAQTAGPLGLVPADRCSLDGYALVACAPDHARPAGRHEHRAHQQDTRFGEDFWHSGRPGKGGTFERQVRATLPDHPVVAALFESLLAMLGTSREQQLAIAKQLGRVARQSGACRLMMTMPDVGPLTAVSFMTTIKNPRRFRRSQDVGAYLGPTSRCYQSGEVDINGRISKCYAAAAAEIAAE